MTARFVRGLADVGAADASWAGGKAAAVGELARAGIPVPRGDCPGCPALHGDPADRIVLLQSRPETVWSARERPPVATLKPRASDHVPGLAPAGALMDLTDADVTDILALLDSLPYGSRRPSRCRPAGRGRTTRPSPGTSWPAAC